jgi:SHAQKYF class myb-like DNA-binding protein
MSSSIQGEDFGQNDLYGDKSKDPLLAGRWTKDEHQRFVEALKIYGKNWKKVEEHVSTRTGAQIRSHAQKFFNRIQKELNVNKGQAIENIAN